MHPQNYMNIGVVVENQQIINRGSSLGDADIQRSVCAALYGN